MKVLYCQNFGEPNLRSICRSLDVRLLVHSDPRVSYYVKRVKLDISIFFAKVTWCLAPPCVSHYFWWHISCSYSCYIYTGRLTMIKKYQKIIHQVLLEGGVCYPSCFPCKCSLFCTTLDWRKVDVMQNIFFYLIRKCLHSWGKYTQ